MTVGIFWYAIIVILGAIIGSFLNVVIYRLHTGRSLNGNSHCLSCGVQIYWYDLFPLISYLVLRGRCRNCSAYIPSRYFWVELLTASLFLYLWFLFHANIFLFVFYALFLAVLVVVAVYDIRHTIIPDELVLILCACACTFVVYETVFGTGTWSRLGVDILAGAAGSLFIGGLWYVSEGRWIGLGDAKLAFPLGVLTGAFGVFSLIVIAFWIGAIISLVLIALQRIGKRGTTRLHYQLIPFTIKSEVPFAPFLILSFLLVELAHADVFEITQMLFLR